MRTTGPSPGSRPASARRTTSSSTRRRRSGRSPPGASARRRAGASSPLWRNPDLKTARDRRQRRNFDRSRCRRSQPTWSLLNSNGIPFTSVFVNAGHESFAFQDNCFTTSRRRCSSGRRRQLHHHRLRASASVRAAATFAATVAKPRRPVHRPRPEPCSFYLNSVIRHLASACLGSRAVRREQACHAHACEHRSQIAHHHGRLRRRPSTSRARVRPARSRSPGFAGQ